MRPHYRKESSPPAMCLHAAFVSLLFEQSAFAYARLPKRRDRDDDAAAADDDHDDDDDDDDADPTKTAPFVVFEDRQHALGKWGALL